MTAQPSQRAASLAERLDVARWPGEERRSPPRSARHHLVLAPLAAELQAAVAAELGDRTGLRVLDVGCGEKPYLPFFAGRAVEYRGLDGTAGPHVDDVGSAERLPYADGAFDVVLCTQVLEHLVDPAAAVGETWRVLAPGGVALASTHGVYVYHPDPPEQGQDLWRWTHRGLERLFRAAGPWDAVRVRPCGEWVAALAYVACQAVDPLAARGGERVRRAVVGGWNAVAAWLDARVPPSSRTPNPGSLSANYLLVARKPRA